MPHLLAPGTRLAVIDMGSNTITMAIFQVLRGRSLDRLHQRGESVRLMRQLGADRVLPNAVQEKVLTLLRSFVREAQTFKVGRIDLVATSAVRDAKNRDAFLSRIQAELGVIVHLLEGDEEGACAASSVVNTLPLSSGVMVDLGGGSMQLVALQDRRWVSSLSFPLGALRVADQFLTADPPTPANIHAIRRAVREQLASVPSLPAGPMIGVGGTLRTLGKIDRKAKGGAIGSSHGYLLSVEAVEEIWEEVSRVDTQRRKAIPGLSDHRADVFPAGVLVILTLMREAGYRAVRLCSKGVREGFALRLVHGDRAPLLPDVRLAGLIARFPGRRGDHPEAARGAALALFDQTFDEGSPLAAWREVVGAASWIRHVWAEGGPRRLASLFDEPLEGFFQEEILAIADLVVSSSRLWRLDVRAREQLRSLLEASEPLGEAGRLELPA